MIAPGAPLLTVADLRSYLATSQGVVRAVDGVSFTVRLHLSCGLGRAYDTFSTLEGTAGRIHISNPFHPGPSDSYQLIAARSERASYPATSGEASFTAAIRHINAVLTGEAGPRLLAADTALGTARALHDLAQSFTARASAR